MPLAPEWSTANNGHNASMDEDLLVIMSGTMRSLAKIPSAQRTWDVVRATMMQNPMLAPDTASVHQRATFPMPKTWEFTGDCDPSAISRVSYALHYVYRSTLMSADR